MINIHYGALREDDKRKDHVPDELLKKAQGMFGGNARKEIVQILDGHIRLQAMDVAQRQINPQSLYEAGMAGVADAIKSYKVGHEEHSFKIFATPFIRQAMVNARAKIGS